MHKIHISSKCHLLAYSAQCLIFKSHNFINILASRSFQTTNISKYLELISPLSCPNFICSFLKKSTDKAMTGPVAVIEAAHATVLVETATESAVIAETAVPAAASEKISRQSKKQLLVLPPSKVRTRQLFLLKQQLSQIVNCSRCCSHCYSWSCENCNRF